jgi:hypothetical protein
VFLLPLAALVAATFWYHATDTAVRASTAQFVGGDVPGQVTVSVHPATWYVYAASDTTVETIHVTDPSGRSIPVKSSSAGTYMSGGREFRAVGQFDVKIGQIGDCRVAVAGSQPSGIGGFAVGEFSVNSFQHLQLWTIGALLVVNVGAAVAIALWPARASRWS